MKGDIGLHTWLAHLATHTVRDFHLITIDTDTSREYNPIVNRTGDEIADSVYEITFADDKTFTYTTRPSHVASFKSARKPSSTYPPKASPGQAPAAGPGLPPWERSSSSSTFPGSKTSPI